MRTIAFFSLLFLSFGFAPAMTFNLLSMNDAQQIQNRDYVPGELLVKYKAPETTTATMYYKEEWGIETIKNFQELGVQHVKLPEELDVEDALEIYRRDPNVEYAEPNYYRHLTAIIPNEGMFPNLWGLHNTGQEVNGSSGTPDADIDAPEAWDITTGSSDVIIAVIDSGVDYNHPDLSANIWINSGEIGGNGIDDDGNGYIDDTRGWNFFNNENNNDVMDTRGHGTCVAGIIGAIGNNSVGVTGVCWRAQIMPVRIIGGLGYAFPVDAVISAIRYASDNGAHIINCSFGSYTESNAEKDAIERSSALFVCSAGNDTNDNDGSDKHYPSGYDCPNIIAVAATDQNDDLASFSNYGVTSVDVAAPGVDIYSAIPARQIIWSDNFDDGDISDWITGGTNNTWGTTSEESASVSYSLTDSPGESYQNNTDSWAITPPIDLSGCRGTKLEFKIMGETELGFDGLLVATSVDMATWTEEIFEIGGSYLEGGITGTIEFWLTATVDFGAYNGEREVYMMFRLISDGSITDDGYYIDDITVNAASSSYTGTEYNYRSGTSVAVPYVTGIAGLLKALNPAFTTSAIKSAIENGVDRKDSLSGKVATGGRVNAYNALSASSGKPDLCGTSYRYQIYQVEGRDYRIELDCCNESDCYANASHAMLYLSTDTQFDANNDYCVGKESVETLSPNMSTIVRFDYKMPDLGSREYSVWPIFVVDCDNEVDELNETNNVRIGSESFTATDASGDSEPSSPSSSGDGGGGGCFIATSACGFFMTD